MSLLICPLQVAHLRFASFWNPCPCPNTPALSVQQIAKPPLFRISTCTHIIHKLVWVQTLFESVGTPLTGPSSTEVQGPPRCCGGHQHRKEVTTAWILQLPLNSHQYKSLQDKKFRQTTLYCTHSLWKGSVFTPIIILMSANIWASVLRREPGLYWIITKKRSFSFSMLNTFRWIAPFQRWNCKLGLKIQQFSCFCPSIYNVWYPFLKL